MRPGHYHYPTKISGGDLAHHLLQRMQGPFMWSAHHHGPRLCPVFLGPGLVWLHSLLHRQPGAPVIPGAGLAVPGFSEYQPDAFVDPEIQEQHLIRSAASVQQWLHP